MPRAVPGGPRAAMVLEAQSGPQLAVGPAGATGPRGAAGPAGATGPRGPSDGYVDNGTRTILPEQANVGVTVARLASLPAGSYLLSFTAKAGDFTNAEEIVTCRIRVSGTSVGETSVVIGNGPGSTRVSVLASLAAVTRGEVFEARLDCEVDQPRAVPPDIQNARLSAIKVDSLRVTTTP